MSKLAFVCGGVLPIVLVVIAVIFSSATFGLREPSRVFAGDACFTTCSRQDNSCMNACDAPCKAGNVEACSACTNCCNQQMGPCQDTCRAGGQYQWHTCS
jgi:hypothetical protein